MFQSNIYCYVKIKEYIVSTQEMCLEKTYQDQCQKSWQTNQDVPRQKLENLEKCTRFLCMHKILVHAQHSCACTTLLCMHWRGQGPRLGPKKEQPRVCACTGILCMHKNLVICDEFSYFVPGTSWYILICLPRFFI